MLELGVTPHTGVALGKDFTIRSLKAMGFDAVYLALGCWHGRMLPFEGKELEGIYSGIDYLRRFHTDEELVTGKHFIIIGAGNVAMDCARSALRTGAESVNLLFRFSRDLMEANAHEIIDAETEGVGMHCLVSPMKFIGESGKLTGIQVQDVTLKQIPGGLPDCIPVEGTVRVIPCDIVIQAVGQGADLDAIVEADGLEKTRFSTIDAKAVKLEAGANGNLHGSRRDDQRRAMLHRSRALFELRYLCYDQDDLPDGDVQVSTSCPNEPHIVKKKDETIAA